MGVPFGILLFVLPQQLREFRNHCVIDAFDAAVGAQGWYACWYQFLFATTRASWWRDKPWSRTNGSPTSEERETSRAPAKRDLAVSMKMPPVPAVGNLGFG